MPLSASHDHSPNASEDRLCEACLGRMKSTGAWTFECPSCGFLLSTLTPGIGTEMDGLETLRRHNYERMFDRIEPMMPLKGARILEVGSARGWFLAAAKQRGALPQGIEPEAGNASLARAAGHRVDIGYFPDDLAADGLHDIIVFNDVFEHIPAPSQIVNKIEAQLSPGGLVVLNCPSSNGIFFRLAGALNSLGVSGPYERLWQKGYSSPHVSYFNPSNLQRLIERNSGLREAARFRLNSVARAGLWKRVKDSNTGIGGALMFAGIWCVSFVLAWLPPDIEVSIFRKREI